MWSKILFQEQTKVCFFLDIEEPMKRYEQLYMFEWSFTTQTSAEKLQYALEIQLPGLTFL